MAPVLEPIIGRYLHLALQGRPHRLYFEQAGEGIPLLCLHTAGADGRQWRHLMNDAEITRDFRVLAFDMPWHGKSYPPEGFEHEEYQLTTDAYVGMVRAVCAALALERPVVMGCSIGGRITLDLAIRHPRDFRALIGLEAAEYQQPWYDTTWLDRADVHGGEVCAALVSGLVAPQSPTAGVQETLWQYRQSGPGVFKGDLWFYRNETGIGAQVATIDTASCPLYLLTGEYDFSCTPEDTQRTAARIPGVQLQIMKELGHFPMSENPAQFRRYLLPVVAAIRAEAVLIKSVGGKSDMLTRRGVLAAGGAATLVGRRARAEPVKPIRIGVLNDPNGVYADNGGVGCVIAARMAAAEFSNTLLGRPIEILAGDNQNKPDLATSIARQWIDTQGVDVIADGASSGVGLALQQVTREKEKIFIIVGPATSDLTGKACSPFGFHVSYDTYALAHGTGLALTRQGASTWFFITADYAFGYALERDTTKFVEAAGGKVLGGVRAPLGTADYSSYLIQAQASGAKAVALALAGTDVQNAIKQAGEFGIASGGQRLAALLIFITDVESVGLKAAQGLILTTPWYWDLTDKTRAWSRLFMQQKDKPPTMLQAGTYSGVRHYLQAVQAAGTTDSRIVAAKMHELPVNDMFNTNVRIREDGRMLGEMHLMQVKTPAESRYRFDDYKLLSTMTGEQAFRPLDEGGCPLVHA